MKKQKKNKNKKINKGTKPNNKRPLRKDEFEEESFQLEGRNSVLEALNHNKTIDKIFVTIKLWLGFYLYLKEMKK